MTSFLKLPPANVSGRVIETWAALGLTQISTAQAGPDHQGKAAHTVPFNIQAQSLSNALTQFAKQTGVTLAYRSEWVQDLRSSALKGNYASPEALALLLADSGIQYRFKANATVVLEL
ncbi:MAG: STN domain-containing protein [Methylobacter sp.]|nr:STN domain-containing protein [Methylobacter sp.]